MVLCLYWVNMFKIIEWYILKKEICKFIIIVFYLFLYVWVYVLEYFDFVYEWMIYGFE